MLTQKSNDAHVQWAIQHKDDHCYQLFRNTIRRWSRNPSTEVKRIEDNGMGRHQNQERHWLSFH